MKATGITAEYNPLHCGHEYHIRKARELSGCDVIVAAMSGDYVQRGEPAVTDKWTRTAMALDAGADLVLEIPVLFSLGNASAYASAAVGILEAAGCGNIAFGSESGDAAVLKTVADVLRSEQELIKAGIAARASEGMNYPSARAAAYEELRTSEHGADSDAVVRELAVLGRPNDILAVEYLMNMERSEPLVIKREGGGYHDLSHEGGRFCSASAVREALKNGEDISGLVPEQVSERLSSSALTFADDWTGIIRYALRSADSTLIDDCPSGGEGLGSLLRAASLSSDTHDGMIMAAKSKRYTYTRLSRLCMQTLLGITRSRYPYERPLYMRVLGFSGRGREYLSEMKRDSGFGLPVITNINRETEKLGDDAMDMLGLDVHAADIYNLVSGRDTAAWSDHVKGPVIKEPQN